jgi:hypothetical protein
MIEERPPRAEIIFERFSNEERLCVIYSLRCNLECGHCNVSSSPRRKERLTLEEALEVLRDGAALGKRHVTFSGGEIFLYYKDLVVMVAEAGGLGYEVDVETNAFFATTPEAAVAKLRPLAASGLRGMCLSCDAYHLDSFGLERPINAYRAGVALDLLVEVNFCPSERPDVDAEIRRTLTDEKIPFLENPLLNRGRARDNSLVALGRTPAHLPPCDSLNTTVHPVGDVFACCELESDNPRMRRTPVFLGNLRERPGLLEESGASEKMIEAFYDPDSPAFFKRLLETAPAFDHLRSQRFLSICDFCMTALADDSCVSAVRAALGRATE